MARRIILSMLLTVAIHCAQIEISLGDDLQGGPGRGRKICSGFALSLFHLRAATGSRVFAKSSPGPTRCVALFDIKISLQHVSKVTRHKVPHL